MKRKKCVLTIAGSDCSGGAGIQADIKAISALNCYAASVITALTAQNTQGVQSIYEVNADFVGAQLDSIFSDLTVDAVKIGMLHNADIIKIVADKLKKYKAKNIILDPVMFSKNQHCLLNLNVINVLCDVLFPLVSLITPNISETEKLLNREISSVSQQEQAAIDLGQQYKINVLVKGGHLAGIKSVDVLYALENNKCDFFSMPRIESTNTHGTGCSLSSAIAAYCARDYTLNDAIKYAKRYITLAIKAGRNLTIGRGCGPIEHFWFTELHSHNKAKMQLELNKLR